MQQSRANCMRPKHSVWSRTLLNIITHWKDPCMFSCRVDFPHTMRVFMMHGLGLSVNSKQAPLRLPSIAAGR